MNRSAKKLAHIRRLINFKPTMSEKEAKEKLKDLIARLFEHGIIVEFKDVDVLFDYGGMNWLEAEEMGMTMPNKHIYIKLGWTSEQQLLTLRHEVREVRKKMEGWPYWPAHKYAEERETQNVNMRNF